MKKPLIVALDPGNVVGIAILDLKGNIVYLGAKKFASRANLVKHITEFGSPLLIASDVNPAPKSVEKVANSLGCKTYYPERSLTNVEKLKLLEEFEEVKGYHQKDALAAAIKAYRHFHPLLKKIEDELKVTGIEDIYEEVASMLIKGETDNIKAAIKKVLNERKVKG